MRLTLTLLAFALLGPSAHAQFDIEDSHTTASLRGIHNVGGGVAWASGTNGTVLRTEDGGYLWQTCNIPPGAEKLDFRGIQAFDENTAIVMSSGTGDLSRIYKTTDGCQTWKLMFTNPDKEGFWDALQFFDRNDAFLLGDPVDGRFVLMGTLDGGSHWVRVDTSDLKPQTEKAGAFAASNSSLLADSFVTGGANGSFFYQADHVCTMTIAQTIPAECIRSGLRFDPTKLPLDSANSSSGAFSVAGKDRLMIAVGGDYMKPDQVSGTAAYFDSYFSGWFPSKTPPHGYRSAVAYDADQKLWIAVGPNGSDISRDDGKNWTPLKPSPQDPPDTDKNWNALSLPFVVGPKGRIGRLRTIAETENRPAKK
jgi:photosystem II stability/assembly factor-like uncharacterized protein